MRRNPRAGVSVSVQPGTAIASRSSVPVIHWWRKNSSFFPCSPMQLDVDLINFFLYDSSSEASSRQRIFTTCTTIFLLSFCMIPLLMHQVDDEFLLLVYNYSVS